VEEVAEVLRLMNWLLALPAEEEVVFREELGRLQKESRMPYISTYDRLVRAEGLEEGLLLGLQKGRQEGREEGVRKGRRLALRDTIAEALLERFGVVSELVHPRLEAVEDEAVLRHLVKRVWTAGSMAEFEAEL
jgi:flagellar biosynthesis/type III secretory pathway protein FliH